MTYYEPDLAGEFVLLKGIHYANPNFRRRDTEGRSSPR